MTGSLVMPWRRCKVFPISEKVKVLDLRKEKILNAELPKIYGKTESSMYETERKKKKKFLLVL